MSVLDTTGTPGLAIANDLRLPVDAVTETFALIANRGVGKSSTGRVFVEEFHYARLPVIILDWKGDWWGLRHAADGGPGLPFTIFGGDHADVPLEPTAGTLLAQVVVEHRLSCVLDLSGMSKTAARRFTMEFAEEFYRLNRDPVHLVVDEADVLIPQRASADVARLLGAMEDLAKRGRHRGIGMTIITQRGADVSKTVLDLCETLIVLRVTGPRTRKAILDWIDDHTDDEGAVRAVIGSLKSLEVGEAWVWSPGYLRVLQRIRVRPIRTFDSHATPKPGEHRPRPTRPAKVDLAALGEQIAATRQRAEANDPAALRRELAAVRGELDRARRERPAPRVERVEVPVPVLDPKVTERLQGTAALLSDVAEQVGQIAVQIRDALARWQQQPTPTPTPQPATPRAAAPERRPPRQQPAPAEPATDLPPLRAGALRMLEVLAAQHPMRLTRTQLGTLAQVRASGGTFGTYFSNLSRAALIDVDPANLVGITQAGLDHLGAKAPAPATTTEILAMYRERLRGGARRMLDVLVDAYPDTVTRGELAARAGITADGGTFGTYLSHLRSNGLAENVGANVRASSTLFLGQEGSHA